MGCCGLLVLLNLLTWRTFQAPDHDFNHDLDPCPPVPWGTPGTPKAGQQILEQFRYCCAHMCKEEHSKGPWDFQKKLKWSKWVMKFLHTLPRMTATQMIRVTSETQVKLCNAVLNTVNNKMHIDLKWVYRKKDTDGQTSQGGLCSCMFLSCFT